MQGRGQRPTGGSHIGRSIIVATLLCLVLGPTIAPARDARAGALPPSGPAAAGAASLAPADPAPAGPNGLSTCASVPGRLLVRFAGRTTGSERSGLRAAVAATRLHAFRAPGLELIRTRMPVERAAAILRSRGGVASVERDCIVHLADVPNDPSFGQEWGLVNTGQFAGTPGADIDVAAAWAVRTDASAVTVAVIDSGMQLDHPDLAANLWTNPGEIAGNGIDDDHNGYVDDVHGWDFINDDNDPHDDNGHGTHVSGTIGAVGNNGVGLTGVAWSVRLMPLKAFDSAGSGDLAAIIGALEYAVANGARISNNSYSGPDFIQAEFDAFAAAAAAGHLAIVAAGNSGTNSDAHPQYPAAFGIDEDLAVAATTNTDALASFSNYGAVSVQVAAPGQAIWSTYPTSTYAALSGTSMATPHVVGVAALVAAEHPSWTGAEIRDRILGTTRPVAGLASKTWTGGVVDAGKALSGDPTVLPPAPLSATFDLEAASDTGVSSTDNVTRAATLAFDVTFNRPVTGLVDSDFALAGTALKCTIGTPTGSGTTYVVVLTGCSAGSIALALRAGTVTELDATPGPPVLLRGRSALIDRTAPTGTAPAASLRAGAALSGSAIPLHLAWSTSDIGGAGIDHLELARSLNGSSTWTGLAARSASVNVLASSSGTVRYRSRSVDVAGNVGPWVDGPNLSPRLVQQTSSSIVYHSGWSSSSFPSFSGGSVRDARSSSAWASYTFTGRAIAIVSTRATTRGRFRVYVNGAFVATVDLLGPTQYRTLAWQRTWATTGTRTVKLVVSGTGGRPRVDLDAFAVLH